MGTTTGHRNIGYTSVTDCRGAVFAGCYGQQILSLLIQGQKEGRLTVRCIYTDTSRQWVDAKVTETLLHTALAWPVGWCNLSDFRDSCEPDFSKEHCVRIRWLRGICSAKRGLEMEEETDWDQISHSDQRSYIKIKTWRGKTQSKFTMLYMKFAGIV